MRPARGQLEGQLDDGVGHADPDRGDVVQVDPRRRLGREGPLGGLPQAQRRDAGHEVGGQVGEALVRADLAGDAAVGLVGEVAEDLRDVLERLALEQPGEQQVALLPERQLLVEVDVGAARGGGGGP